MWQKDNQEAKGDARKDYACKRPKCLTEVVFVLSLGFGCGGNGGSGVSSCCWW